MKLFNYFDIANFGLSKLNKVEDLLLKFKRRELSTLNSKEEPIYASSLSSCGCYIVSALLLVPQLIIKMVF
jgi:hypothetical protein